MNHLNDKSGKMSKSKGDFLTVSLLQEKGYDPIVYRMFCLQSHYRKPLEFSYEVLDNMSVAYKKLVKRIADLKADGTVDEGKFAEYKEKFCDAISNDLNTSMAITIVYDLLKDDTLNDASTSVSSAGFSTFAVVRFKESTRSKSSASARLVASFKVSSLSRS